LGIEVLHLPPCTLPQDGVLYVVVKGKAHLSTVMHKKTASTVTLQAQDVDQRELATSAQLVGQFLCSMPQRWDSH